MENKKNQREKQQKNSPNGLLKRDQLGNTNHTSSTSGGREIPQAEINRMEASAYKRQMEAKRVTGQPEDISTSGKTPKRHAQSSDHTAASASKNQRVVNQRAADTRKQPASSRSSTAVIRSKTPRTNTKRIRKQARMANARRHHKNKRRRRMIYSTLLLFLLLASGVILSTTVFFNIEQIVVQGDTAYGTQDVMDVTNVKIGDNLLRHQAARTEQLLLSSWADLDDVTVKRVFPATLLVDLVAATPQWIVLDDGKYYMISSGGRVIQMVHQIQDLSELVVVTGITMQDISLGTFLTGHDVYESVNQILQMALAVGEQDVVGIAFSPSDIQLNLEDRILLKLGNMDELEYKMTLSRQLRESEIKEYEYGILDVSVPGKGLFEVHTKQRTAQKLPRSLTQLQAQALEQTSTG